VTAPTTLLEAAAQEASPQAEEEAEAPSATDAARLGTSPVRALKLALAAEADPTPQVMAVAAPSEAAQPRHATRAAAWAT